MKTKRIETVDHRLLILERGDRWPDCLVEVLEKSGLTSGTFRGAAVLRDVEVRTLDAQSGTREGGRRLEGPIEAVVMDGAFGLTRGNLAVTTRAVLALRDSFGERITAGSLESARIDGGEVLVAAFSGTDIVRTMRSDAGVWLFQLEAETAGAPAARGRERERDEDERKPARVPAATGQATSSGWAALAEASEATPPAPSPREGARPAPLKAPAHARALASDDEPIVEQGAVVDHFSFGEGDVLKSDGERVHVRFERDGRIREFSLGVLRVTAAGTRRGKPYFKIAKRS
jgi:hypothetical protein